MKLLLDTQLLLWSSQGASLLPPRALALMSDASNELYFSSITIWEVAIKQSLGRKGFRADASFLYGWLLRLGYGEVPLKSSHSLAVLALEPLHGDPFDRILLAQAISERMMLVTADAALGRYAGPVLMV